MICLAITVIPYYHIMIVINRLMGTIMAHSTDIKNRVLSFINEGGSKADAAKIFKVGERTIYSWLYAVDIPPKTPLPRVRKLKKEELIAHLNNFPNAFLRERAQHFGVRVSTISMALKRFGFSKKNDTLRRKKSQ